MNAKSRPSKPLPINQTKQRRTSHDAPRSLLFFHDLTQIPATALSGSGQQALFCAVFRFHPVQNYLNPETLEYFLDHLSHGQIVHLTDPLGIHFFFTKARQVPLAMGPFCTELLTVSDCRLLFRRLGSLGLPINDYLAYRSPFPVIEDRRVLHLTRCLLKNLGVTCDDWEVRDLDCQNSRAQDTEPQNIYRPYARLVEERYAAEQRLMENISRGNRFAAIANWRDLHNYVAYTRNPNNIRIYDTKRQNLSRHHQNLIRIAAMKAGIPAV